MQKWNLVSRYTCPLPHFFSLWFCDVPKLISSFKSPVTCFIAWVLCQWFPVDWQPACISSCLERMEHRLLLNLIRRCWFSCQTQCRDHFGSPAELCVTWVCSDSLYSGLGKWHESLLCLALIKIAPAVQVLDTKIWSGQCSQGSCDIEFKTQFQLWHACWKSCSSLASSLLPMDILFFYFLSNLSLSVSAHVNLLCLYHATLATFFSLNIEPCWSPPTQPTSLLVCITPSCSMRHGKLSRLLEEDALGRAFLRLVQNGAQ